MKRRFNFSKAEKVGAAVLSLIIVVLLVLLNRPHQATFIDVFVSDTTSLDYIHSDGNYRKDEPEKKDRKLKIVYKKFDPNHYKKSDWERIGFSEKQSQVILNFKKQINGFKSKEDIKNCYVINARKYKEMEPFLQFDSVIIEEVLNSEKPIHTVELNGADKSTLETVNGIGSFYANKIIEFRNQLGGYYKIDQIKEVYGMTDENFKRIENQIKVDSSLIKKINVSTSDFNQLKNHPYLNWKQSQFIVGLPDKKITDKFWDILMLQEAFTEFDIKRLKPYLE